MDEPTSNRTGGSTQSATVLFVDVVASTATMIRIGDDAADDLRRRLFEIYRQATSSNRGTLVKTMGDGAMAVFTTSAIDAVRAGVEMTTSAAELIPRSEVRVGIASGDVSHEHDDWFGTPVVLASRLCDVAAPNQVLCSEGTRTLVGSRGDHGYVAQRPLRLKGFDRRVPAFAVAVEGQTRSTSRSPWLVGAVLLVAALLIAAAVVATRARDGTPDDASASPVGEEPSWQRPDYEPVLEERPCTDAEAGGDPTIRCSTMVTPVDRTDPDGPQVRLPVNWAASSGERRVPTPVVHLTALASSPTSFATRSVADVVQLGLRGSDVSEPTLACDEVIESRPARLAMRSDDAEVVLEQDVDRCHQRLMSEGIDLEQFDPLDMADDLRDLAAVLGVEQIDVVARQPDDTFVALAAVRRHPGLVRSLTLFDPVPVGVTEAYGRPQAAAGQFEMLVDRCGTTTELCGDPPLEEVLEAVRAEVDEVPQLVEGMSSITGATVPVLVDGDRLVKTAALALNDSSALPFIPRLVRDRDLVAVAGYLVSLIEYPGVEPDVRTIVSQCTRSPELSQSQLDTEARLATWGALADTGLPARCQRWGLTRLSEFERPVASDVPTLVLRGGLGAGSVLEWHLLLDGLANRQDVVFANEAFVDNASGGGCGADLRRQFVIDPTGALDVEACEARDEPIDFVE